MIERSSFLLHGVSNETAIRFAYADAIVQLLCQVFGYKVTLEESEEVGYDSTLLTSGSIIVYGNFRRQ